jgi:hypothetical protein
VISSMRPTCPACLAPSAWPAGMPMTDAANVSRTILVGCDACGEQFRCLPLLTDLFKCQPYLGPRAGGPDRPLTSPPLFGEEEYSDWEARPDLNEAWRRLPIVRLLGGFKIRYLGPLIDLGHDVWLSDLSTAAYGYLLQPDWYYRPWTEFIPEGPLLYPTGHPRSEWSRDFRQAVEHLVRAAEVAGPEPDPERWASWLCFELHEPNKLIRAEAERRGWGR